MPMLIGHNFLEDLALVLCVAAIATVLCQLLRQPLVVGYLVAGMVVGPYIPLPVYVDPERIREISDLGVILLIFSIGLEFRFRRLVQLAPTAGVITLIQVTTMILLGYAAARLMGWTPMEAVFTGAVVSISSTTIVAKAFEEQVVERRVRELSFGVLLAEDLVAIILLALLTAAAGGEAFTLRAFAETGLRLLAFLALLSTIGLFTVPYAIAAVARLGRPETLMITAVGMCFAFAMVAEHAGYSVALGAFLAGSLTAESGHGSMVEHLVEPIRDIFGAIFFVSVGMLIEPNLLVEHWHAVALITGVVVVGKITGVSGASLVIGERPRVAIKTGFALAQIGEFSFIMAEMGRSNSATRDFLYSLAVAVSTITAFLTPFLIRASQPAAQWLERAVPAPLAGAVTQYVGWVGRMRGHPPQPQIEED
ncbi:MAG TPA: cation:proton antiporter [Candidatus Binataceae bacterium]|jgi:CPA2 family monovalent cation:H+ antiporter-2|nr:cation:proton antiporter [Candidatus Binataceae bacterium]